MKGINNPIGIKSLLPTHNPFIMNAYRFAGVNWATALLNWAKRKEITINGASKTADAVWGTSADQVIDDFTTYTDQTDANLSWTPNDNVAGKRVNVTNDNLEFALIDDGTNNGIAFDLGSAVSDTTWILRGKIDITSISNPSAFNQLHWFGISSTDETAAGNSTQDFLGLGMYLDSAGAHKYYVRAADAANLNAAIDATEYFSRTLSAETLYVEIIRLSSTKFRVTMFSDSEYTEVLESKDLACPSTITGLQYVVMKNQTNTSRNGIFTGTLDDVKLWDGETVVENIPGQQTATLEDDFSGTDDWADQGSGVGVNTTTDRLEFSSWTDNTTNNSSTLDLGSALSDTDWTIRFKLQWTGFSNTTDWTAPAIGMFSASSATAGNSAQDMLFYWSIANGATKRVYLSSADNSTVSGTDHNLNLSWVLDTTYYIQLQRDGSSFSATVWTGSYNGTEVASGTDTIGGTVSGLQYFGVKSPVTNRGGSFTGWIDDVQVWDNFSGEVNPTTLTDYPLPIKIIGDADLQEKTTETFEELFTSTSAWTAATSNITFDTTIDNELDYSSPSGSSANEAISHDLTSTSNTTWVLDYDLDITGASAGSGSSAQVSILISDKDETAVVDTAQDYITHHLTANASVRSHSIRQGAGGDSPEDPVGTVFSRALQVEKLYCRLSRLSETLAQLSLYADSARTILHESQTIATTSSTTSLRYLKVILTNKTSGTHVNSGHIDNIRFWNGITNPVNQETATFTEAFTSSSAWSAATSNITFDTTTDMEVDFNIPSTQLDESISHDLTSTSSKWCLRGRLNLSSITANTDGTAKTMVFGISNGDYTVNTRDEAHDMVGFTLQNDSSAAHFTSGYLDGQAGIWNMIQGGDMYTASGLTGNYYLEVSYNDSSAICTIYSDSSYSIVLGTATLTGLTLAGLRYIYFGLNEYDGSTNGTSTGHLDDISFWNGVTTPNAEGRKIVFTDNAFDGDAVEYASETTSYDPINGDWTGYVKIPSLATGADTTIQMYYDYTPSATPSYAPEALPSVDVTGTTADSVWGTSASTAIEDFTTYTDQTDADNSWASSDTAKMRVNVSTDLLETTCVRDSSSDNITYDLGLLSDTAWTIKYSYKTTVNSGDPLAFFGLSSINSGDISNSNQDSLYLFQRPAAGTTTQRFALASTENVIPVSKVGANQDAGTTLIPTTNTTYWIVFSRTSTTSYSVHVYEDSTETVLVTSLTGTCADTITSLRYFVVMGYSQDTATADLSSEIDDMELWDGSAYVAGSREQQTWNSNYKAVHHLQGNSTDSTVYGNDGTDTAVDYEQQNNSVGAGFDGSTSKIPTTNDSSIANIWAGGGVAHVTINPKSDGGGNYGRITDKNWWWVTTGESSGFVKIRLNVPRATTAGTWETTSAVVPLNELTDITIIYNSDSVSNDPVFVINGIRYTVGNGITELSTPAGSATDETSNTFRIGSASGDTNEFDGLIDNVRLSDKSRPSSEAITSYNAEKSDSDIITAGDENTQ